MTPEQLVEQAVAEHGDDVTFEFADNDRINVWKDDTIVCVYTATPKCPLCAACQPEIDGDEHNQQILNDQLAMNGVECKVRVSIDEDILTVPFTGVIHVQGRYNKFHDVSGQGEDYCSNAMIDPTWLQIAVCANDMINVTGNEAHYFLEGLAFVGECENGEKVYEFVMGS